MMENVSHDPDQPLPYELSHVMLPIWRNLQAMEKVAAGDPKALALYQAGQRFKEAQAQQLTPQQRRNRLNPVFTKLSAASIFVDEIYETVDGHIQIESFGSAERLSRRLTEIGFYVTGAEQDRMDVETNGVTTTHLYALIRINAEGLL